MKKNIISIFIILIIAVIILHFFIYPSPPAFPIHDKNQPILIAHAGGEYDGKTYTNSVEAVTTSLKNGYKFIEIDLQILTDNKLGGIHDMIHFNKMTGFGEVSDPVSSEDFKNRKIYGNLSPLLSDDIVNIFKNSDAFLVTDKIEEPLLLEKEIPLDKKRMLIETFSYKSYLNHVKHGYDYPMLCIGDLSELEHYWPLFVTGKVKIITFPAERIPECQKELTELINKGVVIFAFSTNDKDIILKYGGTTVSGFYTDSVTYENLYE